MHRDSADSRGRGLGAILALTALVPLPASGHTIFAPPDRNVTLLGQLDSYTGYSDVWGYTTPGGDEWALIGTRDGISIIDATNPSSMQEVVFIPGPTSSTRDIKTWDHYAYFVTEGSGSGEGLQIVDLSTTPPALVNTYSTGFTTAHNLFIDERGLAYICGATDGMHVLSLADPENPVEVGFFGDHYIHDTFVRGGIQYASQLRFGKLAVMDVNDPGNIQTLGSISYPQNNPHNVWPTDDGAYALTTDELEGGHLRVFDVTNPVAIVQVGAYQRDAEETIHNATVRGDLAFISYYVHGLRVVDVTDPRFPSEVGGYDTFAGRLTEHEITSLDGAWGVYPFSPSGNVYISDISSGLYVFSFSPDYGAATGVVRDRATGQPLAGADVHVLGGETVETLGDGTYRVTAPPGPAVLQLSGFGYEDADVAVDFPTGGAALALDPELVALPSGSLQGTTTTAAGAVPLGDVQVTVLRTPVQVTTDAAGGYIVDSLPEGYYEVRFDLSGHTARVEGVVVVRGETGTLDADLDPALLHEDMETDPLWQVGAAADTATGGIWERVDPTGTQGGDIAPEDDATPDPGTQAWVTGDAPPVDSVLLNDVDGGSTSLTSSPIAVPSGTPAPFLTYARWFRIPRFDTTGDELLLEVSAGGDPFKPLHVLQLSRVPWEIVGVDLSPFAGSDLQLRFVATDAGLESLVEAGVDEIAMHRTCQTAVNPFLPDGDADGEADSCDPCPLDPFDDLDGDGACGDADNAPRASNPGQEDGDGDGVGDAADNCPATPNPDQLDADRDGSGNACDPDDDDDGTPDDADPDDDGDGVSDAVDLCPGTGDPLQADLDGDGRGDACDPDDGLVTGVRLDAAFRLTWDAEATAGAYRVRRGTFQAPVDTGVAACLPPDRPRPAATDPFLPRRGEGFFYVITTLVGGVDGPGGTASDGSPRVLAPCTAQCDDGLQEICGDGLNNDCDGDTDCRDADCIGTGACPCNFDGICGGSEDCTTCPDCPGDGASFCCGDGICEAGEDPCGCSIDCGSFTPVEQACADRVDNDCDGLVDCLDVADCSSDPPPTPPAGFPALELRPNGGVPLLLWTPVADADRYDVVEGDVATLFASGGDFSVATTGCAVSGVSSVFALAPEIPAVGGIDWVLVRGANCGGPGSYDSGAATQSAPRDAGIQASGIDCP